MSTTASAIRDRMITLTQAVTPSTLADTKFRVHREAGDFRSWAMDNPTSCFRRFSVRDTFQTNEPDVTNLDLEWVSTFFDFSCAYPKTYRAGRDGNRDTDDLIEQDMHTLLHSIGTRGYANYTDGVITDEGRTVVDGEEVRFLEFTFKVQYYRAF